MNIKTESVRGILGLIIIVGVSACTSKVSETASNTPSIPAPSSAAAPQSNAQNGMVCVPGVYNRLTKMTENYDCSVVVTLADGTQAKDQSRTVRVAAADMASQGYTLIASAR